MTMRLRWTGAAMIAGGLLFFLRMGPIFAVLPDDISFPPASTEEMIRLYQATGARWQLSHALGLVAVGALAAGYWGHIRALKRMNDGFVANALTIAAAATFPMFAAALVTDGFIVPHAITSQGDIIAKSAAAHALALRFFTPAVFALFVTMGLLSSRILHRRFHTLWLGLIGMLIAIAAVTLYLSGLAGAHWDNLRIGGSAMMLGFFWHILIGASALFGRGARIAAASESVS